MRRFLILLMTLAASGSGDVAPAASVAPDAVQEEVATRSGWGPRTQDWTSVRVSVRAAPVAGDTRVGKLRFAGGIVLASEDAGFGGLSGLYVDAEDRLLAVSDGGDWFSARLVHDDAGALVGLADANSARLHGENGQPLGQKKRADAEGLARLPDGRFAVSFERTHVVRLYDLASQGPAAAPTKTLTLAGANKLDDNDSLEALAAADEALIVGAEGVRDVGPPFWIAPFSADAPAAPAGRVRAQDGFGLVSLDRLPDGDFVAMERFFAPLIGVRIYIRRVTAAGLAQGRWEGETIAELAPPLLLDNFEGIAAVQRGDGVRLYIVSDDNFSRSQKTLLYAFDLAP